MICAVPSAVRALVAAGAIPPSVRAVGLAGEAVTGTIADDLYATGHVEVVANLYGPTEDTTYSTQARLRPGEQRRRSAHCCRAAAATSWTPRCGWSRSEWSASCTWPAAA